MLKNRRALTVAVIAGFLSLVVFHLYFSKEERRLKGNYEMISVLVATKDIMRYERIEQDMVTLVSIPKPYVAPLAVLQSEKDKVVGFNMADAPIKQGEQITKTKLALMGEGGISPIIPTKMRACTVAINEVTGVSGLIRNRDTVDVIATFRVTDQKSKIGQNIHAITMFQNVPVLSVGRNYMFDRQDQGTQDNKKLFSSNQNDLGFSSVTLLLNQRQCMDLVVAQEAGEISLALRSYHDRFDAGQESTLKDIPSTTESATGIKSSIQISKQPRWLEIRGHESSYVQ